MKYSEVTLIKLFDGRHLHEDIVGVSRGLFVDCHYAQAILAAVICVDTRVQDASGLTELSGTMLMDKAFDEKSPVIQLADYPTDKSLRDMTNIEKGARNDQAGFRLIFKGVIQAIRNEKAHNNIVQEDTHKTLEYLGLFSLLLRRIDERVAPRS